MYGADFRPGMRSLPRHDNVAIPPVEAFAEYFASVDPRAMTRNTPCPAKFRRVCFLCESGESLHRACELVGISTKMVWHFKKMPDQLRGRVLAKKWPHG